MPEIEDWKWLLRLPYINTSLVEEREELDFFQSYWLEHTGGMLITPSAPTFPSTNPSKYSVSPL